MADKISPIKPGDCKLAQHAFQSLSAEVPAGTLIDDLENPELWVHVVQSNSLEVGDEIRVIPEDMSFIARLLVTYVNGTNARVRITASMQLDEVVDEEDGTGDIYRVQLRSSLKWCIIEVSTGDILMTKIPTKSEAIVERDALLAKLAA